MPTAPKHKTSGNIFLRMHPLQRILLSLAMSLIVFLLTRNAGLSPALTITLLWDVFALSFICCSWIVFFSRPIEGIIKRANKEDGSKPFVLSSILVSSFASMFTVLLLIISKEQAAGYFLLSIIF